MIINNDAINNSGPFSYIKKQTQKFGLLFEPIPIGFDADRDSPIYSPNIIRHFDKNTVSKFEEIFLSVKPQTKSIIEIGVDAYYGLGNTITEESSTSIILRSKNKDAKYVGIDIQDKTRLNNIENNIYTIREDSINYDSIVSKLHDLGVEDHSVGFIYIDGWHSINHVFMEWNYITKFLAKDGVALFHDTNYHPGSRLIFDAIDDNIFTTKKYFIDQANWGLGEIRYK